MSEIKSIPCKWCGAYTYSLGTKECDRCWELRTRIENNKVIAAKIFTEIFKRDKLEKIRECHEKFKAIICEL